MISVVPLQDLHQRFRTQLRTKNKIRLLPFSQDEWFRGAYSTIQRTLRNRYRPLTRSQKSACATMLFDRVPKIGREDFDDELKALIESLAKDYAISCGHAQKLVSILIKYAAACCHVPEAGVPDSWKKFIKHRFNRLPVPVDAVVLFQLSRQFPDAFNDVKAGSSNDKKERPIYWAKIQSGESAVAWSSLSDYTVYWSIQSRVRDLVKAAKQAPLEFEMRSLWASE